VQSSLSSGRSYSPSSYGVITSWGAAADADADQPLELLVLRHDGGTQWTALQKDLRVLTTANTLNTFTGMRIPIEASQEIGIYLPPGTGAPCEFSPFTPSDTVAYSTTAGEPSLNAPTSFGGLDDFVRANVQAGVEPDTDRDVFGDESQDKCVGSAGAASGCPSTVTINKLKQKGTKKVKVTVTVPGAGTLAVGSPSDPSLASASAKSLKAQTRALTAVTEQTLKLTLKLTPSARSKLGDKGTLKVKVKAVYTPAGGPPGSALKKKKLKR
jgi:hypothetical protein